METIRSGKQLCDEFFDQLPKDKAIDSSLADLLQELYAAGDLTRDRILEELKELRRNVEEERES